MDVRAAGWESLWECLAGGRGVRGSGESGGKAKADGGTDAKVRRV